MKRSSCASSFAAALTVVAAAALSGCEEGYEGPPRAEVTGTVTWDGQPVEGGTINFLPADGAGNTAGATITGGKYTIEEAKGPEIGKSYKVLVNWGKKAPGQEENLDAPLHEHIPAQYNSQTTLTTTFDKSPAELNYALPQ